MRKVYIAGDMLPKGSQMLRAKEREDVKRIGLDFYNPMDNKDINDKSKVNNDGLAERIVQQDTDAIESSDVIVIEPQPFAQGTLVELGQVKGRKDLAKSILEIVDNETFTPEALNKIVALAVKVDEQKVYPHYEDVRRFENAGKDEEGDRRSLGINQYVYGTCLELTDGVGFYEWNEVLDELKKIKKDPTI
ncbi:nucleoside 2-deoxyribosyltransferase [Virgibacillus sp. M23]|uniref:nucleoside 2-deoxyribosyltransferase n=1 Tax=Virgibacillus sp. M23 TaxID=3079030 RepID=UPI002A9181E7|nr:nucleoside 2-deoxyribosyltransferase [Virgibacillus sp. M23]MDY7043725.1 nucleoside 2-deoxyribosyltransferase [Virgibacillus sp. M23]